MVSLILTVLIIILLFGLLVGLHEFGHMITAKLSGVWVQEFSFGFGPKLFSKKIGDTLYKISLFPLGGYVKLYGETRDYYDEDIQREFEKLDDSQEDKLKKIIQDQNLEQVLDERKLKEVIDNLKDLSQEEKNWIWLLEINSKKRIDDPRKYSNKRSWQKLSILCGGVLMNFIFGVVIYIFYLLLVNYQILLPSGIEMNFWGSNTTSIQAPFLSLDDQDYLIIRIEDEKITELSIFQNLIENSIGEELVLYVYDINSGIFKNLTVSLDNAFIDEHFPDLYFANNIQVNSVFEDSASYGYLQSDDVLININEKKLTQLNINQLLEEFKSQDVYFKVKRNNEIIQTDVFKLGSGADGDLVLGISHQPYYPFNFASTYFAQYEPSVFSGGFHSLNLLRYQTIFLKEKVSLVFKTGQIAHVSDSVGGPIRIGAVVNSLVETRNYLDLLNLAGFISLTLAFMNIMPLPLLDGGFVCITIVEAIRRKPLGEKFMKYYSLLGIGMIVVLSILVFSNDIWQVFFK